MLSALQVIWRSMRPPFLLLTLAMLLLAYASVDALATLVRTDLIPWLAVSALAAAAASNLLNEYFDLITGIDQHTQATPFSGGSQALVAYPYYAELVKWVGLLLLSLSVWSGFYLMRETTYWLLPLGLLGVALLVSYSLIINRFPWLCLFAPGLGYGLVMFVGSSWVLNNGVVWSIAWLLPIPMLLVSGLLLLNQFPDVQPDAAAGRNHAVIAWGRHRAYMAWLVLHGLTYGWLIVVIWGVGISQLRWSMLWLLVSLLSIMLAWPMRMGEVRLSAMALNTLVVLGLPVTIAVQLLR